SADGETADVQRVRFPEKREAAIFSPPVLSGLHTERSTLSISRDASRMVYLEQELLANLWLVGTKKESPTLELTRGTLARVSPRFSPDGKSIAYECGRGTEANVFVQGTEVAEPRQVTFLPGEAKHPYWSPDGSEIAYIAMNDGKPRVCTVPVSGGTPRV